MLQISLLYMLIEQLVRHRCPAPREDRPRYQELLEQLAQEEVPGGENIRGRGLPPPEPPGLQHVIRRRDAGAGPAAGFLQQRGLHGRAQPCQARLDRPYACASSAAAGPGRCRSADPGGPG